nr:GTP-binding protein [Cochlodiniinecator piscidefendens]
MIEEAAEETVLLQSGCLCCAILCDLTKTLVGLIAKRAAGKIHFDRVVIETSGIADPGPIIHTLGTDYQIAQAFRLDGVVTLADAATGMKTLNQQLEAVHQVAMADVLILSKTDLIEPFDLSRFEKRLKELNASAQHILAHHGSVPVGTLFGLSAMRSGVTSSEVDSWLGMATEVNKPDPLADLSGFSAKPKVTTTFSPSVPTKHQQHDHRVSSASIEVTEPIPANVFDFWLDTLIALKGANILRMKGILHVEGLQYPFVFHGVQHIFDAPVPLKNWPGKDTTSRVVVIARDMEETDLKAGLEMLLLRTEEGAASDALPAGMMAETIEMPF